ncbi:class II fructose-bisphosphate aldolase, partial [Escherichia coli]|uniref:class II fructose-bisphosphate aldolase n=1 Tax=Escherichia coli TaxID=562 RepID=UPI002114CA27
MLISIAEVHTDQFDEATLLAATVEAAAAASVPVAIHYDHGSTLDRLVRATQLGYTSLMIDGSHLDWGE